ncbi:hypothetical protein ABPG74_002072 [Tetrahymena malaccensis]
MLEIRKQQPKSQTISLKVRYSLTLDHIRRVQYKDIILILNLLPTGDYALHFLIIQFSDLLLYNKYQYYQDLQCHWNNHIQMSIFEISEILNIEDMSQTETFSCLPQADNTLFVSQPKQQLNGLKLIYKISILSLVIFGTLLAVNLYSSKDHSEGYNLIGNVNSRLLASYENDQAKVGYQTLNQLINGLNNSILDNLKVSYLIKSISDLDAFTKTFYGLQDFPISAAQWIYEDPNYGFKSNPQIWMDGFIEINNPKVEEKSISIFLINYFKLDWVKMDKYWSQLYDLYRSSQQVSENEIKNVFDCYSQEEQQLRACLTAQQWAGLKLGQSVANLNKTMSAQPEIAAFQQGYFKQNVNSSSKYQNIKFPKEWAIEMTKISENNTQSYTLVDQSRLSILFSMGQSYNETKDNIYLESISDIFLINKYFFGDNYLDAAYLFWQYAVYMVDVFAELKNYKSGGLDVYKKSLFDSQKLSSQFQITHDNLAISIIGALMLENFKTKNITDCESFAQSLMQAENLCEISLFKNFDLQTMRTIYECKIYLMYSPQCQQNYIYNFNVVNNVIQEVDQQMHLHYQCISEIEKCSYYEIAAKQWNNLEAIHKLPSAAVPYLPSGRDSVAQWIPNLQPYEWGYYVEKYGKTFSQPPATLTYNQTTQLLGYDVLFSNNRLTQLFLIDSDFSKNYFFKDPSQIRSYFNWLTTNQSVEAVYQQH